MTKKWSVITKLLSDQMKYILLFISLPNTFSKSILILSKTSMLSFFPSGIVLLSFSDTYILSRIQLYYFWGHWMLVNTSSKIDFLKNSENGLSEKCFDFAQRRTPLYWQQTSDDKNLTILLQLNCRCSLNHLLYGQFLTVRCELYQRFNCN